MLRRNFMKLVAAIPALAVPAFAIADTNEKKLEGFAISGKCISGLHVFKTPHILNAGDTLNLKLVSTINTNECNIQICTDNKCIVYGYTWKDYGGAIEISLDKLDLNDCESDTNLTDGLNLYLRKQDELQKRVALTWINPA